MKIDDSIKEILKKLGQFYEANQSQSLMKLDLLSQELIATKNKNMEIRKKLQVAETISGEQEI